MLEEKYYGLRHDVWGMGVLAFFLFSGKFPFKGETNKNTFDDILNKSPDWELLKDRRIDSKIILLIRGMLEKDKNKRLTIRQVMNNTLFRYLSEQELKVKLNRILNMDL